MTDIDENKLNQYNIIIGERGPTSITLFHFLQKKISNSSIINNYFIEYNLFLVKKEDGGHLDHGKIVIKITDGPTVTISITKNKINTHRNKGSISYISIICSDASKHQIQLSSKSIRMWIVNIIKKNLNQIEFRDLYDENKKYIQFKEEVSIYLNNELLKTLNNQSSHLPPTILQSTETCLYMPPQSLDMPPPPGLDMPPPPGLDMPLPPGLDMPPPQSLDMPLPSGLDMPLPHSLDMPLPPGIDMPPPGIYIQSHPIICSWCKKQSSNGRFTKYYIDNIAYIEWGCSGDSCD